MHVILRSSGSSRMHARSIIAYTLKYNIDPFKILPVVPSYVCDLS